MMALRRWVKRLVPDGVWADARLVVLALEPVSSRSARKRDMRLGVADRGTVGAQSGASASPSVSCMVDIERSLSDSSSSVAGDAGLSGDAASSSPGCNVSGRDDAATCECAVCSEPTTESTRDGPLLGPADTGDEYMLTSSRGSRGSGVPRGSLSGDTRRRFGAARLGWFEFERSRLFPWSLPPRMNVEMRLRRPGRGELGRGRELGAEWEFELDDELELGVEEVLPMVGMLAAWLA